MKQLIVICHNTNNWEDGYKLYSQLAHIFKVKRMLLLDLIVYQKNLKYKILTNYSKLHPHIHKIYTVK